MNEHLTIKDLYRKAIPSVVSVYVTNTDWEPGIRRRGAGSGFVYDDNHIITNQHVVGDSIDVELRFSDGQWQTGQVIGVDPYTDLAVLTADDLPSTARPLPVATENPEPGERVAAIGNPMGLDGTITVGYVSGTNRSSPTGSGFAIPETIQTDAAVNPGNSGGPLLTLDGTVVGVNRAKTGDNIGFAIAPVIVNRVVPSLIEEGVFHPAYLNVQTLDVSPAVSTANKLDDCTGVLILDVGDRYGGTSLRGCDRLTNINGQAIPTGGDVVVGIDEKAIRSTEELTSYLLTEVSPGDEVDLTIRRNGRELIEHVTLVERPIAIPNATTLAGRDSTDTPRERDPRHHSKKRRSGGGTHIPIQ